MVLSNIDILLDIVLQVGLLFGLKLGFLSLFFHFFDLFVVLQKDVVGSWVHKKVMHLLVYFLLDFTLRLSGTGATLLSCLIMVM